MAGATDSATEMRGERFSPKTNETAEHPPHGQSAAAEAALVGDSFGAKAFSTALNAEHENALRRRQSEFARFGLKATARLLSHLLNGEAPDVLEAFIWWRSIEKAIFADICCFSESTTLTSSPLKALLLTMIFAKTFFRFTRASRRGRLQQPISRRVSSSIFHLLNCRTSAMILSRSFAEVFTRRERVVLRTVIPYQAPLESPSPAKSDDGFKRFFRCSAISLSCDDGVVFFDLVRNGWKSLKRKWPVRRIQSPIERNSGSLVEVLRIFGIEWKCRPGPSQCCSSIRRLFSALLAISTARFAPAFPHSK